MSGIGEYLWWLLPNFLKKKGAVDPAGSTTWNLVTIQGEALDESKTEILSMRDQHTVETAEAEQLDLLGDERETKRFAAENDDAYRARIFVAAERKQKVGTKPYMETMVFDLGFGVEVTEVWTFDRRYWAEFIVHIWGDGRTITVTQEEFFREVDKVRPAHTRAVYQIDLPLDVFDDGELFDSANRFDSWSIP